jgi:uncharacterized membrane protein
MNTLIASDDTWLLWTVILAGVALSIYLEQTYSWAAKLSGPVMALLMAMGLANLRIMPPQSPVYDTVQDSLVPLALPLLLFRAHVLHIVRSTGWLFVAFHLASVGTVVGAIVATVTLQHRVECPAEIAAIMTGSYIGGGVNFIAIKNSYGMSENIASPLLVADNFIMAGLFVVLLLICGSRWARRWYPHPHTVDAMDSRQLAAQHWRAKEISLLDIASALAIAVAVVALARATSAWVGEQLGKSALAVIAGNLFVHITFWSTFLATTCGKLLSRIRGAEEIGAFLLYVFLFVIGLPADLWQVIVQVPLLFVFCLIMAAANLFIAFAAGKLLRLNLEDIVLAVNASLGGPPTAAAMAIAMGWSKLVLPALLVGIWGYTIGTAVGLTVGELLRDWLAATP